jgi:hypothetical protein
MSCPCPRQSLVQRQVLAFLDMSNAIELFLMSHLDREQLRWQPRPIEQGRRIALRHTLKLEIDSQHWRLSHQYAGTAQFIYSCLPQYQK